MPEMKIVKEEIFGPVAVLVPFKDEEGEPSIKTSSIYAYTRNIFTDAIRMANDTTYGLAASVFSMNIDKAIRTSHNLQAGTVGINCTTSTETNVPFGGYKQSGIGIELGEYALATWDHLAFSRLAGLISL
jgi:aldehyde dehydrogenase (NAD+)